MPATATESNRRAVLFEKYAFGHQMIAFGEVSQRLRDLSTKHAGGLTV